MALKLTIPSIELRLVSREISGSTVKALGLRGVGPEDPPRPGTIELPRFGVDGFVLFLLLPLREAERLARGNISAVSPRAWSLAGSATLSK